MKAKHFLTIIIAVITLFALCMISCGAENEQPTFDKKTFVEIYDCFWYGTRYIYDVNSHQHYGDMFDFDTDSNGIPYADERNSLIYAMRTPTLADTMIMHLTGL